MQKTAKVKIERPAELTYPYAEAPPPAAARLDELLAAYATPRTGMMRVIFKREIDAQETLFAMGETLSRVNHLHQRGRLARSRGDDGIYRYAHT